MKHLLYITAPYRQSSSFIVIGLKFAAVFVLLVVVIFEIYYSQKSGFTFSNSI